MFLVIRKPWLWGAGLFCCFFLGFAAVLWCGHQTPVAAFSTQKEGPITVVVDPGHGGEDGGASSADGALESHINLAVATRLYDMLRFTGQRTIMTRSTEDAIYTEGDTIRARKVSDTHNRVSIVNHAENAVLLSIHQNSLPSSPATHGAFVFWNQEAGAEELAGVMQDTLNCTINIGHEKRANRVPGTIYLMGHVTAPGILIECGFLSNAEEAQRLQQPSYQLKLATVITAGYLNALAGEETA